MFPNADTMFSLNRLEHGARLREAGRDRLVAVILFLLLEHPDLYGNRGGEGDSGP